MQLTSDPAVHLTYCLNIHPGESWEENFFAIRTHTLKIRDAVGEGRAFGLGLRLGETAVGDLMVPGRLAAFKIFLEAENMYVFTINGFPQGRFHGTRIKENIYQPDWRSSERCKYTCRLGDILAELLPDDMDGSISTVPGSYNSWIQTEEDIRTMAEQIHACACHFANIEEKTGKCIRLALEPEPDCYFERTEDTLAFFRGPLRELQDQDLIRRHVGLCFDTCHFAVQYEGLAESMVAFQEEGIAIAKVQISNSLQIDNPERATAQLRSFTDDVYLHQTKSRSGDGTQQAFPDLPDALAAVGSQQGRQWRTHFHVPLFFDRNEEIRSTNFCLTPLFFEMLRQGASQHLEIETYTYCVLPESVKPHSVEECVSEEYRWVMDRLCYE